MNTGQFIWTMEKDSGLPIKQIKVDGGMVTNEKFLQFLSNILILNCDRPKITETTTLGAAYLVGLSSKIIKNTEEISKKWQSENYLNQDCIKRKLSIFIKDG